MSDFEKRVKFYLESRGWNPSPPDMWTPSWSRLYKVSAEVAFYQQLKEDFKQERNIERAAELLDKA
jgi:hypothetical protein